MRTTAALLIPLLLAACTFPPRSTHEAASIHEPVVYSCDEGRMTLRVRFTHDAAYVTLPSGEEVVLPQQPAASGMAYGTPQNELRGKGDEATWTTGRRVPIACRVLR